jgi:hypothetical protein
MGKPLFFCALPTAIKLTLGLINAYFTVILAMICSVVASYLTWLVANHVRLPMTCLRYLPKADKQLNGVLYAHKYMVGMP